LPFHHPPEVRKVLRFQDEILHNTETNQLARGRAAGFAHGQKASCRWQPVPVYKWCWVTFGKQSMVISRECRSFGPVRPNWREDECDAAGTMCRMQLLLDLSFVLLLAGPGV
jgi:hypothetical protein